ncbi:MAG: putative Ig domain-containing protein [Nostoc sp. ChiSLP02]|nr:putative Ig domain-containing protein [Nostoc sp. DedSLP05]MDZ8102167.1 putative Ig domain-containing protein [Nostoc sp. DedSLP01]MDZ8186393.1 putative Ig domain-containing protein [Nostoc sp. ChiSLP02]
MPLAAGNIAFVGFNADGNDNIAFVTLVDINPGEVIIFEDNEWNGTGWVDTNEGAFSWTATSLVTAGTIVTIDNIGSGTITASTGTAATGVSGRGGNRGIGANDETIYAYQGSATSPTFITAIASGGFNSTNGLLTGTGLTAGTNAIDFSNVDDDVDIAAYNGSRSGQPDFPSYLPLINNAANWQTQDGTGDQSIDGTAPDVPFSSTAFTVGAATPTVNLSVSTNTGSEAGTTAITVTLTASSAVSGNQTVNLAVIGTNITAGDYNLSNTIITIPSGSTTGSITFTVVDDALVEGTETATLTISNPSTGITLGATTTQNITITDNDGVVGQAPTIQLDTASTTDLLDANGALPTTGTGAISGVIGNANDPAKTLGVNFTIADADTPVENLTVTVTSSNAAVVPNGNLTLTGTGASRNLKINPVGVGTANITVSVSDGTSTANYAIAYAASANNGTATTEFLTGASDASTATSVGGTFFLEADDENQVLRLYDFSKSGLPITGFDFTSSLGLTQTNSSGVFREVDIEASTRVGDRIFWLGSQSNNDEGNNRPNRDRVFATDVSGAGASTTLSYAGRYDFLKEDIINWDVTNGHGKGANYYGLAASAATNVGSKQSNGYNIEGLQIAPNNTTAYIAFRAPQIPPSGRSNALIVQVTNFASLISANGGTQGSAQFGAPIELDLGDRGIREIRKNANNQYVIIAGPAGDAGAAPNDFRLYTWDGNPNSQPQLRAARFPAGFNPEGIITIPENLTDTSQIQFVSDDGDNVLYNNGTAAKDLSQNNFKKFRTDSITLGAVVLTPRIHDIQGASHISPLNGQRVDDISGIVTVVKSNGFYLQDPNPDNDDRTSEAIFVFTSSAPTVAVGDSILASGTVSEFRPGGNANNLTTTQIVSPTIVKLSSGNTLPAATILGNGGRTIPTTVIDNDTSGNIETGTTNFDPAQDGIDFYESLEGMLVQVNNPVAVSPTNSFGEIWVLADNGANATGRTARGGIAVSPNDFNPERIQIDDTLFTSGSSPQVNVGATLNTITGVVDYNFSNYEVLPTSVTVNSNSTLTKEVTNLTPTTDQLTIATFNVENLDPGDGATKFNNLASRIVNNLKSPDIISLEEIQDNNGPTNDSVVDASTTFQTLINAIVAAGGPTYQYRQINPVDDTNGGEPGGNIRVGFLFNPNRVSFVDRPGGTSTSNTTVTNNSGVPVISNSPGLIDPTNSAFNASRKPLVGEFTFNGETVYVIGNHFNSKGGDQPLYGPNQPPTLSSETQRQQQATLVKNFVENILAIAPNANVVVAGDLNDFEFSRPVTTLESAGLTSLIETLPQNQRYTYNFEGNAQTLDHILVSQNLLKNLDGYDVVHVNSEFFDQDSDHDPSVARFNISGNDAPQVVQPIDDQIISTNKAFSFNVSNKFTDIDPGDTLTYSATGLPNGASIIANTGVISGTVPTTGIFAVTVTAADAKGLTASDTFELTVANNKETPGNDIIFVDRLNGANKINAQGGNDRVIGTNASESINGAGGNDYLDGKGGADILTGGNGSDTILGGLGSDKLSGQNGNDRLIGWGGGTNEIDLLNGNQDADTYVLGDGTSVFYSTSGNRDYAEIANLQAGDRIQLKGVAANYSLGSASAVSKDKSAVGIFTKNGAELIAVVEDGLSSNTNLATDTRFVFV